MENLFKKIFSNSAIMALFGVILGSLISGTFAFQTQKKLIEHQENIYKDNYQIEKNKILRRDIESFVVDLSYIIINEADSIRTMDKLRSMTSTSLKIALLNDYNIGNNCIQLTENIKSAFLDGKFNETQSTELITNWILSIKTEMKIIDYSIDKDALERDFLNLFLNGNMLNKKEK